jgi:hypothetical protein
MRQIAHVRHRRQLHDVPGGVAQSDQLAAFGQLDWIVEKAASIP